MSGTLHLSPKLSPFPYAAAATATYTQKAELVFDEAVANVALELNGSKITEEAQIVLSLAKAAGLADDSSKVRSYTDVRRAQILMIDVVAAVLHARGPARPNHCRPGHHLIFGFS